MQRERRSHLSHIFHSLSFRLILMFLLIVLVTVSVVSFFADLNTAGSFNTYVSSANKVTRASIINWVESYNQQAGHHPDSTFEQWMVEQFARDYQLSVFVVDSSGQIIASPERKFVGRFVTQASSPSTIQDDKRLDTNAPLSCAALSLHAIVLSTDGTAFCPDLTANAKGSDNTLQKLLVPGQNISPEQRFLSSVAHSLFTGILLAMLIALGLALLFSYTLIKPLKRITCVARRMELGDLTQRLVIRTRSEIDELAHALNTLADRLQRSERLRNNMISDIAHELRTPLSNIRGYLEALEDRVLEPTPAVIASLYEESSLLTRLVADLQELSLAEAEQLRLVRQRMVLQESILTAVQMMRPQAEHKSITLQVDLPGRLFWVEADPERVAQILRNLISNAFTHTPTGGLVVVSAVEQGDEIVVSVRDNGAGIEAQHLPYVFERFYRADPSRTRSTGGSGLGLAIVKQVVQAHGGRVHVESQPGSGSCFSFTLPTPG